MAAETLHAVILALVQGITEFLPVSSSAHLILAPRLLGWGDQGLAFDVAVHLGTLVAVVLVLRQRVTAIIGALMREPLNRTNPDVRLGWSLALATIPVVLAGLLFGDLVETRLRAPLIIASTTILFGLALGWADLRGQRDQGLRAIGLGTALLIGAAQALALVPGTSRSGITMTAGLLLGLGRRAAAEFSFLLSIPVIVLAAAWQGRKLLSSGEAVPWDALGIGFGVSALFAYATIRLFLAAMERMGMMPFVFYRLALGALLVAVFA